MAMTRQDIERVLSGCSPEAFEAMSARPGFSTAMDRLILIASDQVEQLRAFGCDQVSSDRIAESLVRRLAPYLSETGFIRLEQTTRHFVGALS